MDALILDENFETIQVIDMYESFIWTDRYRSYGDFEIYMPMSEEMFALFQENYYIYNKNSDRLMIIEEKVIDTDADNQNHLTISGRSLESILGRRIIWTQTKLRGKLQDGIKKLITESIISPKLEARKISNFVFEDSTDERITNLEIKTQFTGDNLYDVIVSLCDTNDIGFKVTLNDKKQFVFKLYKGADRSFNQNDRPYVIFSPSFDNLINSKYTGSITNYKNVALVTGEGEGTSRKTRTIGTTSGLLRRELYVDARDISSEGSSKKEYNKDLDERGTEKLYDNKRYEAFEGGVDPAIIFVYGKDYEMGDLVQVRNEFEIESISRIDEIIFSQDSSGFTAIPTFTVVSDEEFETEGEED